MNRRVTKIAGVRKLLWRCPKCSRTFANRNQSHFCGSRKHLQAHFKGKQKELKPIFRRLLVSIRACGPITVLSEKTRITFHRRMSFMVVSVQKNCLRGHFVFPSRIMNRRFLRIDTISRRNHVHQFRLSSPEEIDAELEGWIRLAYAVGEQRHLEKTSSAKPIWDFMSVAKMT